MLKHRLTLLFIVATLFVGATLPAIAADAPHASIPFDFVVQGVNYPAGTYRVIATSSSRVVIVRNESNLNQSFIILLPMGESLLEGNAHLSVRPKSSAPSRGSLQALHK